MSRPLRIAWLTYRGNPLSGGQGVYTRYMARELTALGHQVTVFSGQPYPQLDDGVVLEKVPGLDLYAEPHPFRPPAPWEFKTRHDVGEFLLYCTGMFPEPLSWSWRIREHLRDRVGEFDLVHDNQCLGPGIRGMLADGHTVLATVHHPITKDRDLDVAATESRVRKVIQRRWYAFLGPQIKVVRDLPYLVTVSQSSAVDIARDLGARPESLRVVPVGVDTEIFHPEPSVARVTGRIMVTTSSDVPLKGLVPLLEALAKLRTERADAHLVVVGSPRARVVETIERLSLGEAVRFERGIDDARLRHLYAEAEVAVVPSLYEGFSLPAVEAMACGVPLVATTGGALPEVAGPSGETCLLVAPGDPSALAAALARVLGDGDLRTALGAAGQARVLERFTWQATAEGTAALYHDILEGRWRVPAC
jgi:glycosyltransferase involved in cell wall biosynthesis